MQFNYPSCTCDARAQSHSQDTNMTGKKAELQSMVKETGACRLMEEQLCSTHKQSELQCADCTQAHSSLLKLAGCQANDFIQFCKDSHNPEAALQTATDNFLATLVELGPQISARAEAPKTTTTHDNNTDATTCNCGIMDAASCAPTVAACSVVCIKSLGLACMKCIGASTKCCHCVGKAIGYATGGGCSWC